MLHASRQPIMIHLVSADHDEAPFAADTKSPNIQRSNRPYSDQPSRTRPPAALDRPVTAVAYTSGHADPVRPPPVRAPPARPPGPTTPGPTTPGPSTPGPSTPGPSICMVPLGYGPSPLVDGRAGSPWPEHLHGCSGCRRAPFGGGRAGSPWHWRLHGPAGCGRSPLATGRAGPPQHGARVVSLGAAGHGWVICGKCGAVTPAGGTCRHPQTSILMIRCCTPRANPS